MTWLLCKVGGGRDGECGEWGVGRLMLYVGNAKRHVQVVQTLLQSSVEETIHCLFVSH